MDSEVRERLLGKAIEGSGNIKYHLRQVLGEGGQGWVYRANYDDPDGFWIVVKVLRPEGVQEESLKRFEREAEVLRMLGSVPNPNPNIVRFYDYGVHVIDTPDGELPLPFLVLEYVDGQTLGKVMHAAGGFGLPVVRARRIMKQVARALATVHERRIVHRDLKPSNILLTQLQGQEVAKVTDFGLVKLPELSAHRTATVAGASLGYAPPEQYEMGNNRVSVKTDVFSFAAILFEALAGNEAFPCSAGDNPLRIVARMLGGERPALARVSATVPHELRDRPELIAALDREIARAVSPDPALRHTDIRELWEAVEPILRDAHVGTDARSAPSVGGSTSGVGGRATPSPPTPPSRELAGQERPSGADAVSGPAFGWRAVGRPMTGERLRAAVLGSDHGVVAVGAHGLYHFARGVWSALHLPAGIDARFIRGIHRMPGGELLLYGDSAFALVLSPAGVAERIPIADRDVTLLGAWVGPNEIAFAGERLSRPVGVTVEVPRGSPAMVRNVEGSSRLHALTRLVAGRPAGAPGSDRRGPPSQAGGALVACGSHGDLFASDGGAMRPIPWGRSGHLYSIAAAPDGGAYCVGSGGHALRVWRPPTFGEASAWSTATLEAVQTTRDLTQVVVDEGGTGWAVGGQARLLQRRQGVWARIPLDAPGNPRSRWCSGRTRRPPRRWWARWSWSARAATW
ncbi:MAG: serine/threonine-protein kinase [Polyangiaceae bacterium]